MMEKCVASVFCSPGKVILDLSFKSKVLLSSERRASFPLNTHTYLNHLLMRKSFVKYIIATREGLC